MSKNKSLFLSFVSIFFIVFLISSSKADFNSFFDFNIFGSDVPEFHEIKDVKEKKQAFFDYMYPLIEDANMVVLKRRALLEEVNNYFISNGKIRNDDNEFINTLCEDYKVSCKQDMSIVLANLIKRVDIIPPSLVLAQAAHESGWGTSRFAQEGNNFFGQWCMQEGCGLVPFARNESATHEVKYFDDPYESIRAYIRNINSTKAYNDLWKIRAQARQKNKLPTGILLADGLKKYSARENKYINDIKHLIKGNQLGYYNEKFWESAEKEGF